jgi:peptidoglycan hydrolase-like protein with peptidoglycan-binding domain
MANEPDLHRGSVGERVQYLSVKLFQHGWWRGELTYSFDRQLEQAVKAFQTASGLPATGIVDAGTWRALAADELEPPVPSSGDVKIFPGQHVVLPDG